MGRVAAKARRQGIRLFITGASPAVRRALLNPRREPAACALSRDQSEAAISGNALGSLEDPVIA